MIAPEGRKYLRAATEGRPMGTKRPQSPQSFEAACHREATVERVIQLVADRTSVSIIGRHWVGRTAFLLRVAAALQERGTSPLLLHGIERAPSLEAFRLALRSAPPAREQETMGSFELPSSMFQLLNDPPPAILIDDVDALDEASWVLIEHLHKSTGVPIIGTSELKHHIDPNERLLIRKAQPVVKIALEELRLDEIHDLLEERLGGPVAPSLSGRIHIKSGGLPGFAIAFADTARSHGRLRKQGAVWHDGPDLWSEEVDGAFESLLFRYPYETREALEMLVITGPLPVEQATALVGQDELEAMEGRGLVRLISAGDGTLVTVDPPGISDYFKHKSRSVRNLRLRARIEETLGAIQPLDTAKPLPQPRHFADVIPQPEVPLIARAFGDTFAAGLTHTWTRWQEVPSVEHATHAAKLRLTGAAPSGELEQIFTHTRRADSSPERQLGLRYLHARWLVLREASFCDIETALRGTSDLGLPAAIEALTIGFHAERFSITGAALRRIEEIADGPELGGIVGGLISVALHTLGGHPSTALERLAVIPQTGWVAEYAAPLRGLALLSAGNPREALEWASSQLALALARNRFHRSSMVTHSYVAVSALLTMDRPSDALLAGSITASGQFRAANILFSPDQALSNALALAAHRSGRPGSVAALLERARSYDGSSDALPMGARGFPAALIAEEGLPTGARSGEHYRRLADELQERGYDFSSAGLRMFALESDFDAVEAADQRHFIAAGMQNTIYLAYLDARLARNGGDAHGLLEAARLMREQRANDPAFKNLTVAAKLFEEAGMEAEALEVREEIASLMASDDPATNLAVAQVEAHPSFTHRELEIIQLIARGMKNSQIAEVLHLSIRTVESHLRNIRRKSGASDRDEIAEFSRLR